MNGLTAGCGQSGLLAGWLDVLQCQKQQNLTHVLWNACLILEYWNKYFVINKIANGSDAFKKVTRFAKKKKKIQKKIIFNNKYNEKNTRLQSTKRQ